MMAYKVYSDCELCGGAGEYEGETDWGYELITCYVCTERYIEELRELLYDLLASEIPNGIADKIIPLLQDRSQTPQERLDAIFQEYPIP